MAENETAVINTYRERFYQCGDHILLIIYRFLSDCLVCRLVSFIFTLQAGIIWLGCKYMKKDWFLLN